MSAPTTCCPPQAPPPNKNNVAHPVSHPSGAALAGEYKALGGFDTVYVTGEAGADHALVVIYDIFGLWETTQKGSDLLAAHLKQTSPTQIFMPDVFRKAPFPPAEDGNKELLGKFFQTTAKLEDRLPEVLSFAKLLKSEHKFKTVSIMGYCWGGKLTLLALGSADSPFDSGAIVHPAMIADGDGDALARPLAFYPSKDEPADVVRHIAAALKTKSFADMCEFHLYDTVHHGWGAARADLANDENKKQYDDVYRRLAAYFARVNKA